MSWIPLAAAIIVLVTSCTGLGYLAGFWTRRRRWPAWAGVLLAFAVACLWPAVAAATVIYNGSRYAAEHPGEVSDVQGMAFMGLIFLIPFLFIIGLSLALVGLFIARRRTS
ncbi:MAG TPA: hypothetical protein VFA21_21920 [Pyrinomonadaceae bacterium]|nr:hypothetical protein [Pyrinomonadaceae bacterium]